MLLRPRQQVFVDKCLSALREHGNTLGVAPTGAGKSLMMAAITGSLVGAQGRAIVVQHRDELTAQNRDKFRKIVPGVSTGVIDADTKHFDRQVAFAMVQTLSRPKNLAALPPMDAVIVDESHHIAAGSYTKIVERARELNPAVKILGVTATPERADSKSLREVFNNIADQITLGELIRAGHLVRPRTFVIDIGTQDELRGVKKTASDFDMGEVAKIQDKAPLTERIIDEWRKVAGDRKTIAFASTVEHATHVAEAFVAAGIKAAVVSGETADGDRKNILGSLDRGDLQVVVNCAVLTEGFDSQPISCVVLLRPSSHKSTLIQMVGRGLRPVDPELHPGVTKQDCIVLDFGTSVLMHGSLEQEASLGTERNTERNEAPKRVCPGCQALVPANAFECGLCGFTLIVRDTLADGTVLETLREFVMTEVDIFSASPFRWSELWGGVVLVATAFEAWSIVVLHNNQWHAVGATKGERGIRLLSQNTERLVCVAAADDFMREHGDASAAKKSKQWLKLPATDKQLEHLRLSPKDALGMTRYEAACYLTMSFNERAIKYKLGMTQQRVAA
jgi:DNA repair protein RadD